MSNLTNIFSVGDLSFLSVILMLSAAFVGGILASISPCSLSMLPLIIGYVGGCSKETPLKTALQLMFFILGTALVFTIIGVICAITGNVFASALGGYFTLILASILLIIGLKIADILDFEIPVIIKSMPQSNSNSLFVYPLLLGVAFALAGTPCSTPILAGIMVFAAMGKNLLLAVAMLFLFSIGQGIILILAGMFTSILKNVKEYSHFTEKLIKLSGWLLIIASVYMYYKVFSPLI